LPRIIIGHFQPNLSSIFSSIVETVPCIFSSTSWNNDTVQLDPSLSYQIRLFVIVEYRNLDTVIVRRVVNGKSQLLVPGTCKHGTISEKISSGVVLPFWCLSSALVSLRLLRFLAQTRGTIRILLSHRLSVRQVLSSVDNNDQNSNLRPIHRHVAVNSCGMHSGCHTHPACDLGVHCYL